MEFSQLPRHKAAVLGNTNVVILQVSNNRDAQNAIHSKLKSRGSKACDKKLKGPIEKQNGNGPLSHNSRSQVPDQTCLENEKCKLPATEQESCNVSTTAPDTFKIGPPMVQEIKIETIDLKESAESDDETQLDWDTEVC